MGTSRPLSVTTVVEVKLYVNVLRHVSEEKTEWKKVKEKRITYTYGAEKEQKEGA